MSVRYVRECDCGWTSDACLTAADSVRLGESHGCAQTTEYNWMQFAGVVVKLMRISGAIREEAVQETALAGWLASECWTPGGMSRRNWVWQQMERGLIDWLRRRLGRSGHRAAWEESWKYLDQPLTDDESTTYGAMLPDPVERYAAVECTLDLDALIAGAALTPHEQRWVDVFLADLPQKTLMDEWGVSEGRVSQVKRNTLAKLRAAA